MVQRAVQVTWDDRPNVICSSKQFGPSSEKSVELEEQTSLFNEPETLADLKAAEPDLEQIVYKRKKQAGKRELDFSKLPTEQIVHELPEGEQACPAFLSGRTAQFGAGERTRTPDLLITNSVWSGFSAPLRRFCAFPLHHSAAFGPEFSIVSTQFFRVWVRVWV